MQHINKKIMNSIQHHIGISNLQLDIFCRSMNDYNDFYLRQKSALEIANSILKGHEKQSVLEYLVDLAKIEPKVQTLQPWVRDHIVHAINTYFLGLYVLKYIEGVTGYSNAYAFTWMLCGLTHDLGYPLEISNNISSIFILQTNEILNKLNVSSPKVLSKCYPNNLNQLCNGRDSNRLMQERLIKWGLDIDLEQYYSWLEKNNKVDHGVIGALAELKIIDAIYQKNNPKREFRKIEVNGLDFNEQIFIDDIIESVSAILIHNINLKYQYMEKKINYKKAPMAFLLYLCDTFQGWDRYSSDKKKVYPGDLFDIECTGICIDLTVPNKLKEEIHQALNKRLEGFAVKVNGILAVKDI